MRTHPKTRICPNCCCELPEEDFLEPGELETLEAALEDELELMTRGPLPDPTAALDLFGGPGDEELDELLEQVVDALLDHGLGETFFEWQGEVAVDRRAPEPEIVLSGTSGPGTGGPAADGRRKNGRLVIEASLRPDRRRTEGDRGDGDAE